LGQNRLGGEERTDLKRKGLRRKKKKKKEEKKKKNKK